MTQLQFTRLEIPDVVLVEPVVFEDDRGYFLETYHREKYEGHIAEDFVQDNQSRSTRDTLRGLHLQLFKPQAKLVRVVEGAVFDVAVDIRPSSPTFLQWCGVELSAENFRQLYMPIGFAHGFCVLSEHAQVVYKASDLYDGADELALRWNDPRIGIEWPVSEPKLSTRDSSAPTVEDAMERLRAADPGCG